MQNIIYKQIDNEIEEKIIAWFGDGIMKYDMLPKREGCYRVVAMCNGQVAGFAAVSPAQWTPLLAQYVDALLTALRLKNRTADMVSGEN